MARDETTPMPTGYFRIEVVWYLIEKGPNLGLLRSAGLVLKVNELSQEDEHTLRGLLQWFNRNLTVPKKLHRVAAIFWFKPPIAGATELWTKLMETAKLLQKYHYQVEIAGTTRPGKIVYEDAVQIAAVPFNDTFEVGSLTTNRLSN